MISIGVQMSVRPDAEYVKRHVYTAERLAVLGGMRLFKLISHIFSDNEAFVADAYDAAAFL